MSKDEKVENHIRRLLKDGETAGDKLKEIQPLSSDDKNLVSFALNAIADSLIRQWGSGATRVPLDPADPVSYIEANDVAASATVQLEHEGRVRRVELTLSRDGGGWSIQASCVKDAQKLPAKASESNWSAYLAKIIAVMNSELGR